MPRPRLLLAALALALGACSLLATFPEDGQLCDTQAPVDQQCLPGFRCQQGLCKAADAGTPDGGGP